MRPSYLEATQPPWPWLILMATCGRLRAFCFGAPSPHSMRSAAQVPMTQAAEVVSSRYRGPQPAESRPPSTLDISHVLPRARRSWSASPEAYIVSAPELVNPKLFPDIEQPAFDNSTPRSVTTQQAQTVYLQCLVNNLSGITVLWSKI
ncbi:hypothetical protein HPB47_020698 [Ixodes persulcatus]|uniref:Uncharacterized protein n=1 Tax=Ixodes persulcatus TaxID=34615 RepID=A0AC60QI80_IXOPE|nr:hypothetical protein HPB47_020698 [Ixodes persulcatus]